MVLPLERVVPAGPPAPVEPAAPELAPPPALPPELCASATALESTRAVTKGIVDGFIRVTFVWFLNIKRHN
jgi:hypothetical protein